jgi:glutathione S-transferase
VVLVLEHFGIPYKSYRYTFAEHYQRPVGDRLRGGLLPSLQPDPKDPDFFIGESLAICEYLAESYPELHLWPRDAKLRAKARTAAAQMHSGFSAIRNSYHTNFLAKYEGNTPMTEATAKETKKMRAICSGRSALPTPSSGQFFG